METLRVLVVDDEPGMRMGAARVLDGYSVHLPDVEADVRFTVEQAATGEEGLERVAAEPPDLVLLDHKLPGMSGLDVLAELAKTEHDLLTVMITAYASLETAVTATKRGAYDFLAKPFTPAELRAVSTKAAKHLMLQRKARRLAEEKRQLRFQFLSVLAHELKSPLAAIEGYLFLLRDRAAGNDLAAYDRAIQRTLARTEGMRKLITDLLDLTRIESGRKKRELARVDVRDVARTAIEGVLPAAGERGITVTLHAAEPVELTADRGELEIICNNLLTNAVKYNRDQGQVDAHVERAGAEVRLRVVDTGIGLTAEDAGRLFNEFVRIKNDQTRRIEGSGLGLSIVKKLAQLYGGDATVASTPGVGSTFTVVLHDAPATAPGEPAGPTEGTAG
jgi:signal transduction histidine kinase